MNKAITDGVILMPPAFGDGLDLWSSVDGLAGEATYDGAANAALVAADADFGVCAEFQKTQSTQKIRSVAETPMLAGCYLRVVARVKVLSGPMPSVRIAGWAGKAGGSHNTGLVEVGATVQLTTYGEVVEVSAIIGSGSRTGVDMVWGRDTIFGHFGIDLTGNTGGVVRVEDIVIEDVTSVFRGDVLDVIDVRDFGAVGDGVTDNVAAFEAADAAAQGRDVLVSDGTFYLAQTVTFASRVKFRGTVVMPDAAILQITQNYNYGTYRDAFGDEELALKKAFQALLNYTDHESLDLCGYSISLSEPLDLHAIVGNKNTFATRRVIRNGQIIAASGAAWDDDIVTSPANYDAGDRLNLTNVTNISSVQVGSLVEGQGVGREVYVKSINVGSNTITLSKALWGATASQTYTFTRFKYMFDFVGFTRVSRFTFDDIEFNGSGNASAVMLPPDGLIFHFKDCFFTYNKNRCITSIGKACSGMMIDRCQFLSNEQDLAVSSRISVGFNTNANDVKIRDNRAVRYKHFGVVGGTGNIISGNHFFQGENTGGNDRTAGMVITTMSCKTTFTSNYIDNCSLDWTNEYDESPDYTGGFSFGNFTVTGNIFFSTGSESWFRFIRVIPHGVGQFLNGFTVTDNVFKAINGSNLDRAEAVDTTYADLDHTKARGVIVTGNTYNKVNARMQNPVTFAAARTSANVTWNEDVSAYLPFGGVTRAVVSVCPEGAILNSSGGKVYDLPYGEIEQGASGDEINLKWSTPVRGKVWVTVRSDNPT